MRLQRESRPASSVRRARPADLDAIDAIEASSFDADRFTRAALKRLIASMTAACLVAEIEGKVVGYVAVLFRIGTFVARIYSIAVHPDIRGRGVAQDLIEAAERAARTRGARSIRLEVRASNNAAVRLYDRAGFTFLERKPGYYQDGEDALRLEKRLEPRKSGGRSAL
jgi:ribosomal-protein-alanine acetyltransferase